MKYVIVPILILTMLLIFGGTTYTLEQLGVRIVNPNTLNAIFAGGLTLCGVLVVVILAREVWILR